MFLSGYLIFVKLMTVIFSGTLKVNEHNNNIKTFKFIKYY
jgi:hypothetical protein